MLIYTSCRHDPGHNSLLLLPRWVMLGGLLLKSHHPGPPRHAWPHVFTKDCTFHPRILSALCLPRGVTARRTGAGHN